MGYDDGFVDRSETKTRTLKNREEAIRTGLQMIQRLGQIRHTIFGCGSTPAVGPQPGFSFQSVAESSFPGTCFQS